MSILPKIQRTTLSIWSLCLVFLLIYPDIVRALPKAANETNLAKKTLGERIQDALLGYETVYAAQDNLLILKFHEQIKKSFQEKDLKSNEPLWKAFQYTNHFSSIHQEIERIAEPKINAYNKGKAYEDQITMEQIDGVQMLLASIREDVLSSNGNHKLSIDSESYEMLAISERVENENHILNEVLKDLYKTSLGHAMSTHVFLESLRVPEDKDLGRWKNEVHKGLVSTYCDKAPEKFIGNNNAESNSPEDKDINPDQVNCHSFSENIVQHFNFRKYLSIDESAQDLNEGIQQANSSLTTFKRKLHAGFTADVYPNYQAKYLDIFSRRAGVLLYTDTLQGISVLQSNLLDKEADENVKSEIGFYETALYGFSRFSKWTKYAYISASDSFKGLWGNSEKIDLINKVQQEAVNPMYGFNHIVNPQHYSPEPILIHNTQDTSNPDALHRMNVAVEEALQETASGMNEIHKLFLEFSKKYQYDPQASNVSKGIGVVSMHFEKKDLKTGIQEMSAYYTSAAIEVAKRSSQAVIPIVESMVDESIENLKNEKITRTIGTVALIMGGVLLLTGVASVIGAGIAGSLGAIGLTTSFMVIAKSSFIAGFLIGAVDTLYATRQARIAYYHYQRIKATTYLSLKETHPYAFREAYDDYVLELSMAIAQGLFTVLDLAALKNLNKIKEITQKSFKQTSGRSHKSIDKTNAPSSDPPRVEQISLKGVPEPSPSRDNIAFLKQFNGAKTQEFSVGLDKVRIFRDGLPDGAKTNISDGQTVFRTYVSDKYVQDIVGNQSITARTTPYVYTDNINPNDRFRITYPRAQGVFFTKPSESPSSVGVLREHYIDFTLPKETVYLELEDNIFLIPSKVKNYHIEQVDKFGDVKILYDEIDRITVPINVVNASLLSLKLPKGVIVNSPFKNIMKGLPEVVGEDSYLELVRANNSFLGKGHTGIVSRVNDDVAMKASFRMTDHQFLGAIDLSSQKLALNLLQKKGFKTVQNVSEVFSETLPNGVQFSYMFMDFIDYNSVSRLFSRLGLHGDSYTRMMSAIQDYFVEDIKHVIKGRGLDFDPNNFIKDLHYSGSKDELRNCITKVSSMSSDEIKNNADYFKKFFRENITIVDPVFTSHYNQKW